MASILTLSSTCGEEDCSCGYNASAASRRCTYTHVCGCISTPHSSGHESRGSGADAWTWLRCSCTALHTEKAVQSNRFVWKLACEVLEDELKVLREKVVLVEVKLSEIQEVLTGVKVVTKIKTRSSVV